MTKSAIVTILDIANIKQNSWVRITNINRINFITDSNVGIYVNNLYFFDTTNELIRVKKYKKVDNTLVAITNNKADEYLDFKAISSFTFGVPFF